MYKVRIHEKTPTIKNPEILVVAMCLQSGDLGAMARSFRSKGIHRSHLAERDMTPKEIEEESCFNRLHWYKYRTWESLIKDEYRITERLEWAGELWNLSRLASPLSKILIDSGTIE